MKNGKVIIDAKIRHGKPVIKGTRITIDEVIGALAGGMAYEEIEKEYGLKKEDILAAISYVNSFLKGEEVRTLRAET